MRTMGDTAATRRWPESVRWTVCFALAVAFHVAGAAALMARWNDDSDLVANAPVITIELAALPGAPETTPNELPPGPQQQDAEPEPEPEKPVEKKQELPADPKAEPLQAVVLPKVVEKPREKKPKQKHASLASAPSSADTKSERAAAPTPGANSQNPNELPNWKSQLVAQLERNKRYPPEAQSQGEQGVARAIASAGVCGSRPSATAFSTSPASVRVGM